jgi:hypothetical protein
MYRKNHGKFGLFCLSAILITVFACNLPGPSTPAAQDVALPTSSSADTPAPTTVQHTLIPVNLPADRSNHAGDHDSSTTAFKQEAPGGDRFTFGQYERPFNADTMDTYFPYLDILEVLTYQDGTWIYATLMMRGRDANDQLAGNYAVELDMDVNGKGDWLVLVSAPASTEWSTHGVQVWQDTNRDVGGLAPTYTDDDPVFGDGFDRVVFGSGQDSDPDLAWARISPDDANTVELAVKRSLFGNDETYLAGMWAGTDSLNPALFDFNDHMTHTEAGAAVRGLEIFYPIKGLAELDATCRVAIGFAPTGKEPGLCKTISPTAVPGCPYTCEYGQNPYPDCGCWPG